MRARTQAGPRQKTGVEITDQRSLLGREVAKLSQAECREVSEYIDIMRSLRREGASRGLFGDGFARPVSAMCDGGMRVDAPTL
jgi:hypothetical protein